MTPCHCPFKIKSTTNSWQNQFTSQTQVNIILFILSLLFAWANTSKLVVFTAEREGIDALV